MHLRGLADNVEFGVHAGRVVALGNVADQFVASGGQGEGGPAGRCGNDAVAVAGTATTGGHPQAAGLVDPAVGTADTLPGGWPAASGNTTTSWFNAPVLVTRKETGPAGTAAGLARSRIMPIPALGPIIPEPIIPDPIIPGPIIAPMSVVVTSTTDPGNAGAAHDRRPLPGPG